jgi:hypothetical protein
MRPSKKVHNKRLRLIVFLSSSAATRRFISRIHHQLLFAEPAAEVEERILLVFPVIVVCGALFSEFGGCGGIEVCGAGCGLEFYDEDFEDFERGGDEGVLVGICRTCQLQFLPLFVRDTL